jgi:hypothetical protein
MKFFEAPEFVFFEYDETYRDFPNPLTQLAEDGNPKTGEDEDLETPAMGRDVLIIRDAISDPFLRGVLLLGC